MFKTTGLLTSLVLVALASAVLAQVPNEKLADSILAARQKNYAMLQQYTWNVRTEILKDESVKDTRIEQVSYGPGGVPQYVLLNDTGAPMPKRFLKRMAAENAKEEMEAFVKGAKQLVGQYTLPTPGAVVNFLGTANIMKGTSPEGKAILQTTGNNVITPGDTLSLTFDAATFAMKRAEITTTFDGQMVTVSATFRTTPLGLTHMQYATIDAPGKQLALQIHNYDYVPND